MTENDVQKSLEKEFIKEKRSDRLWRNIRSFIWMAIVIIYAVLIFGQFNMTSKVTGPYVSVVRLSGSIMPGRLFSVRKALPAIREAFADKSSRGVILLINSPGGSAAQASIIYDRVVQLKKQYNKKLVVVGEDSLASGAYLVSSAADKIYVNRDTLTGSIGVVLSGFGFVDALHKLGITRRVFTAGTNKDRLDPFEKLSPEDITKIKKLLVIVHNNFIQDVEAGRGSRLKGNKAELFSGDFWTGETAVKLGLVDGTGDLWSVMRKEFHVRQARDYSPRPSLISALTKSIGVALNVGLNDSSPPLKTQAY
jgi:protease IV